MAKHQLKPHTIYCGDNLKMLQEIKPLDKDGEIEIVPITVKDLLRKESWGDNPVLQHENVYAQTPCFSMGRQ
ncbi:MAG: hypothetical protein IPP77_13915 [Bacteroidetes bacterium]|nr:hypothetical protein [Bacteroidota bacterium]